MAERGSPEHLSADAQALLNSPAWKQAREDFKAVILSTLRDCVESKDSHQVAMLLQAGELYEGILRKLIGAPDRQAAQDEARGMALKSVV